MVGHHARHQSMTAAPSASQGHARANTWSAGTSDITLISLPPPIPSYIASGQAWPDVFQPPSAPINRKRAPSNPPPAPAPSNHALPVALPEPQQQEGGTPGPGAAPPMSPQRVAAQEAELALFNQLPTEFKERTAHLLAYVLKTQTYNMPGRAVLGESETLQTMQTTYNEVSKLTLAVLSKYHGQLGVVAVDGFIQWWHALLCGWGIDDPSSHPDAFPSKTPGSTMNIVELMVSYNRVYVEEGGRLLSVLRAAGTTCLRTDVQHGYDHVFWPTSWPLSGQKMDSSSKEGCFYLRAVTRYMAFMQGYRIHQAALLSVGDQPTQYLRGGKKTKPNVRSQLRPSPLRHKRRVSPSRVYFQRTLSFRP